VVSNAAPGFVAIIYLWDLIHASLVFCSVKSSLLYRYDRADGYPFWE
jgi:hypothetical protein